MRKHLLFLTGLLALHAAQNASASDLGINVIVAGEIHPGVYGQVQIGNAPRPVVVYEQPRVIVVDRRYEREEPIYLHVPPGHAKHWDKHCREYHACERRVYFVRSEEYEPAYQERERERYEHEHHDNRKHGKGHDKH
jgi:hypothetical protein